MDDNSLFQRFIKWIKSGKIDIIKISSIVTIISSIISFVNYINKFKYYNINYEFFDYDISLRKVLLYFILFIIFYAGLYFDEIFKIEKSFLKVCFKTLLLILSMSLNILLIEIPEYLYNIDNAKELLYVIKIPIEIMLNFINYILEFNKIFILFLIIVVTYFLNKIKKLKIILILIYVINFVLFLFAIFINFYYDFLCGTNNISQLNYSILKIENSEDKIILFKAKDKIFISDFYVDENNVCTIYTKNYEIKKYEDIKIENVRFKDVIIDKENLKEPNKVTTEETTNQDKEKELKNEQNST